ncbi:hypothetical protein [Streptomyces hygroscopicus]|uniref:hypothetical protein n=1 Tax=Streptomyces hygroscopicus TaxID=1912 RepID=UPI0037BA939D
MADDQAGERRRERLHQVDRVRPDEHVVDQAGAGFAPAFALAGLRSGDAGEGGVGLSLSTFYADDIELLATTDAKSKSGKGPEHD